MNREFAGPRLPWWRIRMVWLVIGGPAAVVVAGVATIVLAVHEHDKPLASTTDSAEYVMRHLSMPRPAQATPQTR